MAAIVITHPRRKKKIGYATASNNISGTPIKVIYLIFWRLLHIYPQSVKWLVAGRTIWVQLTVGACICLVSVAPVPVLGLLSNGYVWHFPEDKEAEMLS